MMAKIYERLLIKGSKNFSDVPENLKSQVLELLDRDGWTVNADGTVSRKDG